MTINQDLLNELNELMNDGHKWLVNFAGEIYALEKLATTATTDRKSVSLKDAYKLEDGYVYCNDWRKFLLYFKKDEFIVSIDEMFRRIENNECTYTVYINNNDENGDVVNHPKHYTSGKYEVIKVIEDKMTASQFIGFLIGNILKYIMRAPLKGNALQDYKKAKWYLDYLIEYLEGDNDE